jgi:hypothetical protein
VSLLHKAIDVTVYDQLSSSMVTVEATDIFYVDGPEVVSFRWRLSGSGGILNESRTPFTWSSEGKLWKDVADYCATTQHIYDSLESSLSNHEAQG